MPKSPNNAERHTNEFLLFDEAFFACVSVTGASLQYAIELPADRRNSEFDNNKKGNDTWAKNETSAL